MTNEHIIEEIAYKAFKKGFYKEFIDGVNDAFKYNTVKDSSERCDLYYKVYIKVKEEFKLKNVK
jgi:hypothetical protein